MDSIYFFIIAWVVLATILYIVVEDEYIHAIIFIINFIICLLLLFFGFHVCTERVSKTYDILSISNLDKNTIQVWIKDENENIERRNVDLRKKNYLIYDEDNYVIITSNTCPNDIEWKYPLHPKKTEYFLHVSDSVLSPLQ